MKNFIKGIIFTILVVLVGLFIYSKFVNKEDNEEFVKLNGDELQKLLEKVNYNCNDLLSHNTYCKEYYSKDKVMITDLSNNFKATIAKDYVLERAYKNVKLSDGTVQYYYDGEMIKTAYEEIFGEGTYKAADELYSIYGGTMAEYDKQTGNYIINTENGGGFAGFEPTHEHIILSSKQDKNQVKITVALYNYTTIENVNEYKEMGAEYTGDLVDCTNNKVVAVKKDDETWSEFIKNNTNKLNHYEFTFNKENNNYILYSVEKVN